MNIATFAAYSNLAVYSSIVVLTLAMIAFAADLAGGVPSIKLQAQPAKLLADESAPTAVDNGHMPVSAPTAADATPGRRRKWAGVAMALTWLGGFLILGGVTLRALSVMRVPWGNMYEFATTGSGVVIAAYLFLSLRRDMRWLGLFVVGPAVLTLGLAVTVYYTEAAQLLPSLHSFWLVIHVSVAILSAAIFTIAFSVTILFLLKARREANAPAHPNFMESLPDAATLDRTAYGLYVVAFPLWTFTLIAGVIWAEQAWGAYWQWDPKEVDVHHLGRLRRLPARPRHQRLVRLQGGIRSVGRVWVHPDQLHCRQRVLGRDALLLGHVIADNALAEPCTVATGEAQDLGQIKVPFQARGHLATRSKIRSLEPHVRRARGESQPADR